MWWWWCGCGRGPGVTMGARCAAPWCHMQGAICPPSTTTYPPDQPPVSLLYATCRGQYAHHQHQHHIPTLSINTHHIHRGRYAHQAPPPHTHHTYHTHKTQLHPSMSIFISCHMQGTIYPPNTITTYPPFKPTTTSFL